MNKLITVAVVSLLIGVGGTYLFLNSEHKVTEKNMNAYVNENREIEFDTTLSSRDYGQIGNKTWSLFECTVLAGFLGNNDDAEKLFNGGYRNGLVFINAIENKLITEEDIDSVPMGLTWNLGGPTPDFMLGKVYSVVEKNVLDDVFNDGENFNSKELQINIAQAKYDRANCNLLK